MKNLAKVSLISLAVLIVFPFTIYAQNRVRENDFEAVLIENGRAFEIVSYIGNKTEIIIPSRIKNLPVTHIGEMAFSNRNLYNVTIPNSITHIGDGAFWANQLTGIVIPVSVKYIGMGAFGYNQLTSIIIPESVAKIEERTFACNQLTSITIHKNITHIMEEVFAENPLTSVIIAAKAVDLDDYSFDFSFPKFYKNNNKKAGTYTYRNGIWEYIDKI